MVYAPSLGDIVLVCQTAKAVHSSFKNAPLEFQTITREIKELYTVLDDIRNQAQKSWSPLTRDSDRWDTLQGCLRESCNQLKQLSAELVKFNSLRSLAPRATERVLYITRNFDAPREELRKRRDELNTQLLLATNDALGQMLRIVHDRGEDERAGRREVIIHNSEETEDDVFSVVSQELERHRISEQDVLAHRAEIAAYIEDLRSTAVDQEELSPCDSVSEADTMTDVFSLARPLRSQPNSNDKISLLGGVPIQELSQETILDPYYDLRGVERPNAFDAWGLIERSLSVQKELTDRVHFARGSDKQLFRAIREQLSGLDPFLILLIADSSTKRDFWNRMIWARDADRLRSSEVSHAGEVIQGDLWPFDMQFHEVGRELLSFLGAIESELVRCEGSARSFREELFRKPQGIQKFRRLSDRQRLPVRLTKLFKGSTPRHSLGPQQPLIATNLVQDNTVDPDLHLYLILRKSEINIVDRLKLLCETFISMLAGSRR